MLPLIVIMLSLNSKQKGKKSKIGLECLRYYFYSVNEKVELDNFLSSDEYVEIKKLNPPIVGDAHGVKYMMYHGLAMIIISNLNIQSKNNLLLIFSIGIILFSFSIFLLSTQSITKINFSFLGPITPIGGLTLIIGWIIFIINSFKI